MHYIRDEEELINVGSLLLIHYMVGFIAPPDVEHLCQHPSTHIHTHTLSHTYTHTHTNTHPSINLIYASASSARKRMFALKLPS